MPVALAAEHPDGRADTTFEVVAMECQDLLWDIDFL